jgi:hypothetical protein
MNAQGDPPRRRREVFDALSAGLVSSGVQSVLAAETPSPSHSPYLAGVSIPEMPSLPRSFVIETGGSTGPLLEYKDPLGLFAISLPKGWFKIRPTAEGDLPDSQGRGRRGSRIFSAGEISNPYSPKVLSVERFPVRNLLQDAGVTSDLDEARLGTWPTVGKGETLAEILLNRRDAETIANGKSLLTRMVPGSVVVTNTTLVFKAVTDVPVTRPEILEEQTGRREIRRVSFFRGELRAGETVASRAAITDMDTSPTAIITALWTSIAEADLEDLGGFETVVRDIQDSFVVY